MPATGAAAQSTGIQARIARSAQVRTTPIADGLVRSPLSAAGPGRRAQPPEAGDQRTRQPSRSLMRS
jgi:hypothetical protein